jgi:hypothetical protein
MKHLLEKFEAKRPEIVFEWKDSEAAAEGWVVINSILYRHLTNHLQGT